MLKRKIPLAWKHLTKERGRIRGAIAHALVTLIFV